MIVDETSVSPSAVQVLIIPTRSGSCRGQTIRLAITRMPTFKATPGQLPRHQSTFNSRRGKPCATVIHWWKQISNTKTWTVLITSRRILLDVVSRIRTRHRKRLVFATCLLVGQLSKGASLTETFLANRKNGARLTSISAAAAFSRCSIRIAYLCKAVDSILDHQTKICKHQLHHKRTSLLRFINSWFLSAITPVVSPCHVLLNCTCWCMPSGRGRGTAHAEHRRAICWPVFNLTQYMYKHTCSSLP